MRKPRITLLDAMADENLFAPWFRDPTTWAAWRAFIAALFALPMTPEQLAIYQQCTSRAASPVSPFSEGWLICGRRAGKSFILALIAVYLACFYDWLPFLTRGERATVMIIAADRKQARVILRYIHGLLTGVPMLARMIERETAEAFDLNNAVTIEVATCSYKTVRGYSICAALLDELAFWPTDDSASPDTEIIAALRPARATIPNAMLLCASSPYARRGVLWTAFNKYFGKDSSALIWKSDTRRMNPSVAQSVIDEAMEADPASAAAEYLAEFRHDLESYVSLEVVERCVGEFYEIAPSHQRSYQCFVDPAGGSGQDSFAAAISHKDGDGVVIDAVREIRPPFSPEAAITEIATLAKTYRCFKVTGDRFAGGFPPEVFSKTGLTYEPAQLPKSDLFNVMLPLLNSGKIVLPKNTRLINQIVSLERQVGRSGKDSISHPPNGHDDVANAVAGAAELAFHRGFDLAQWNAAWG